VSLSPALTSTTADAYRLTRRALVIGGASAVAARALCGSATAAAPRFLRYTATHSFYGEIGSYSNAIEQSADMTVVRNEVHLLVSVFGIIVHREDAQRTEHWRQSRLVAFQGVTTVNGKALKITGTASEQGFNITTPGGTTIAPTDIRPSNPWSAGFLSSQTLLRTDTGTVEQVQISAPTSAIVTINRARVATRAYEVTATPAYKVWLDPLDIPVMFSVTDDSGLVTFTLTELQ